MTTETTKTKKTADLYIFEQDAEGNNQIVGAVFRHSKGNGMNLLIGEARYSAFPPKANPVTKQTGKKSSTTSTLPN